MREKGQKMRKNPLIASARQRPLMVAMIVGTALTSMSQMPAEAGSHPSEPTQVISDINRYCTSCWRNARLPADSWNDCTQEVLTRLLQSLPRTHWTRVFEDESSERREFVRAIDAVKKRTQRARRGIGSVDNLADSKDTQLQEHKDQKDLVFATAREILNPRQQEILRLSFDGWTVQDISRELGAPAERVSDDKYKAIKKLRYHLAEMESRKLVSSQPLSMASA